MIEGLLNSGQVAKAKVGLGGCKEKCLLTKGPELDAEAPAPSAEPCSQDNSGGGDRPAPVAQEGLPGVLPWRPSRQEPELCHQKQVSPWLCLYQLWDLAQASNLSDI